MGKKSNWTGDHLEVKLRDSLSNPIYKKVIQADSAKEILELVDELKHNGVDIEMAIVERGKGYGWW